MSHLKSVFLAGLVLIATVPIEVRASGADGWITHPDAGSTPVVLHFRREIELQRRLKSLPVQVTADNRFVLYVNGARVASGPSAGTAESWRVSSVDLAPHLRRGPNVIAAVVWNFGDAAPMAQHIVATGFRLTGENIGTDAPGWRVAIDEGHTATKGSVQIPWQFYVASAPESIDANAADWGWTGLEEPAPHWLTAQLRANWREAVPAPQAAARTLVADRLPPQQFTPAAAGVVVRSNLAGAKSFPAKPVVIPAGTRAKLLLSRDAMISAYPELDVAGGEGARIQLLYAEALYDAKRQKGDRAVVGDLEPLGIHDTFIADGLPRTFAPLWWRTWRYLEIDVTTAAEPLTLVALRVNETGYPFEQVARFSSSDPELDRIWNIGWRTLRVDAHDTFMDSSFWEQLQYTGDTRLQMLITYAVSGDARLAEQAIDTFAESNTDGGLMQGRYPTREPNVIATFSFAWVGMLHDWALEQPDTGVITRHLPRMREVLAWFEPLRGKHGLLGKNPQWNFIDWAGQDWDDRDRFPSWGADNGSCLMTAMWVGALRQGAALEAAYGESTRAAGMNANAERARTAIRERCWDADRQLFADDGDRKVFSQHMNVFAVLYDIATPDEAPGILERITVPGRGIDAPEGMYTSTYYFAWYLVRAFEHSGQAEKYHELLRTWRDLLKLNYTTWPESRGQTRSDTHAWSAHPTADLLGLVAGIRPAAPGYARLRVAPHLGHLTSLDATAATPHGPVTVSYRVKGDRVTAVIDRPAALPGEFIWRGVSHPLDKKRTRLELPLRQAIQAGS